MKTPKRPSLSPARCLAASLLAVWFVAPALALEGLLVAEEDGRPVGNAEISVAGRAHTTRSDPEGRFVLVPDPHLPFEFLIILPGGRYSRPVLVEALPAMGPLVVRVAPLLTDVVTVSPGTAPGIETSPASGASLVSREDLRSQQPQNLSQALENTPGVSNASEGQASVPVIRGLAQGRSVILIDGARVTAERRIGPSATYLDPFVLESVEVARGPGSVAYGSDAFGGVILARTRRPKPGGELSFGLSGTLGTGIPQRRAGFEVESGITDRSGILFSVHAREFGDYESPEGEIRNSGSRDRGFLARYACLLSRGIFSVGWQGDYGREIERPRTNSNVVRFNYPREDSNRLTLSYDSGATRGFDSIGLSLFFGDYRLVTDQDSFPTATVGRRIERADVSARDFGTRATAARHWGETRFDFGVDIHGRWDLEAEDIVIEFDGAGQQTLNDTTPTIEGARRIDAGLFASAVRSLARVVSLAGGVRIDRVGSRNEGGHFGDLSVTHSEPSGFAALTVGPSSGFVVTLQAARGFRDARLSDRFFRGVTGAGFITGNPDLTPETSDQFDLVVRHASKRWGSAIYIYDYHIENLIERYEDPAESDLFFFRNRARARIRGIEVETQAELPEQVGIRIAAGVSEGESRDDGGPLDDIAPESLSVQVRKDFDERAFVQIRGAYLGELDEPGPNEVSVRSRALVDVSSGLRVTRNLELRLLVRNLFDEAYALSPDGRSPLAPGIAGSLTARYTF